MATAPSSPAHVHGLVESLVQSLQRWDPRSAAQSNDRHAKQAFIDALTEISALPADGLDMEVRRLLVDATSTDFTAIQIHLDHLAAALEQRDVLLKCKVANAIGSLCTSRVAGQQLLDSHGELFLPSLVRMATSKNTWAQADAFFVFGWVVVIGEDELVHQHLARFVSLAVKLLKRNLTRHQEPEEQDINMRIYCLVFLLNWSQRDASVLASELEKLLAMLQVLMDSLLEDAAKIVLIQDDDELRCDKLREHIEFGRLTVTLLAAIVDQIEDAVQVVLALRMLPDLLKLERAIHSETLRKLLQGAERDQGHEKPVPTVSDEVLKDMTERIRFVKDTILSHR